MCLMDLKRKGYELPQEETDLSSLTVNEIIEKVRGFQNECSNCDNGDSDFYPGYFLELLTYYPVSLCKREMTDTLKLLITLFYLGSKPGPEKNDQSWKGYSYGDLSLIFNHSKASIHEAIKEKEAEAKILLGSKQLRKEARETALSEPIEEEKQLVEQNDQKTE